MWFKPVIIFFLFYFFALLQNSFLVHFGFYGISPNLIFILFFTLIYFSKKNNLQLIYFAIFAGFFLDIFSGAYFGISVILLAIIGFLGKKIQLSFRESKENYPIVSFLALFLLSFVLYESILNFSFGLLFFIKMVYNLLASMVFFFVYKKILKLKWNLTELKIQTLI